MVCRAEKPVATDEDESDIEPSSSPRRYGGNRVSTASQQSDSSSFLLKKCSVVPKKTKLIERAVREGYSSFTYVRLAFNNGKIRSQWQIEIVLFLLDKAVQYEKANITSLIKNTSKMLNSSFHFKLIRLYLGLSCDQ